MKILAFTLILAFLSFQISAQVYTNKPSDKQKSKKVVDSTEYNYALPILGKRAHERGFDLPYSAGLSVNYFGQKSDIIINNLRVGFNKGTMYNLDNIIRFNNAIATSNAMNIRPDFWLFPFLNVYGIFAASKTSTEVDFTVNVPNGIGYTEVFSARTKAEFQATTIGFGLTPTFGVHGAFVAIDMNFTWSDIPELKDPAYIFVFGPRVGKNFHFKKERALAVWVGGFRVQMASGTEGQLSLQSLFEGSDLNQKIQNGFDKLNDAQTSLDSWWNGLNAQEKAQNAGRYALAQKAIDKGNDVMGAIDAAGNRIGNSTVEYALDKRQAELWNLLVGTQYQVNKSLMFRVEAGFLGSRNQLTAGIQYRFGL